MLEDGADENTVNDTLEAVMDDFKDKADGYGAFIRQLEAEINAYDAEIERFTIRKRIAKNAVDNMKRRLLAAMDATGTEEVKGDLFKFKPRYNAPQLPKDITLDDLSDDIRDTYNIVTMVLAGADDVVKTKIIKAEFKGKSFIHDRRICSVDVHRKYSSCIGETDGYTQLAEIQRELWNKIKGE